MPVRIEDPVYAQRILADREKQFPNNRDEVWEGVFVLLPMPNNEHQRIVSRMSSALSALIDWDAGDQVLPGANVSDWDADWMKNYRDPDVVVYLAINPAKNSNTHWVGGPDLLVEVVSPGEDPRLKLDFYAKVNTREVLIVDRDPWALELYQLGGGKLVLAGKSDETNPIILTSGVLPLTFGLQPGTPRPNIHLAHTTDACTWTA
jgi:Uma2 family endonuclease